MQHGLIFNIQKYSVHDGPGIRTTVFLKGCPLHCRWCHNPESISRSREMIVLESRCIGCEECARACPRGAAAPGVGAGSPDGERCELCGACIEACPTGARQMVGKEMSADELLKVVLQDQTFYEDSGGGVTFSGGEPLSQAGFLLEALAACRKRGVRTAVDTCGLVSTQDLLAAAPLTNLFLYDLKVMDDAKHQACTGASNRQILSNLKALSQVHSRIWLRVPVIPGLNDDEENLAATARFAASLPHIEQVNLLPFHRNGAPKSSRLGRANDLAHVCAPSTEAMDRAARLFAAHGLAVKVGG